MREPSMSEPRNRVVQVRRFGGPDGLEVVDAPLPTAGRGDVRVRVLASSVQYTDVLIRRYRGRSALREFFAASIAPPRSDRMRWHAVAFDSVQQVGFGEYTYRGQQHYHGIVVVQIEGGLIRSWREYQYGSPLSWEAFVGPSR
jgi:hypothetical protein